MASDEKKSKQRRAKPETVSKNNKADLHNRGPKDGDVETDASLSSAESIERSDYESFYRDV